MRAPSQLGRLCVFAEWLDGDVYVGSYLVMVNLPDVCVFLPNGPHRFTLCHQTFSLALGDPHGAVSTYYFPNLPVFSGTSKRT